MRIISLVSSYYLRRLPYTLQHGYQLEAAPSVDTEMEGGVISLGDKAVETRLSRLG